MGCRLKGSEVSVGADENVLELTVVMAAQRPEHPKCHGVVRVQRLKQQSS